MQAPQFVQQLHGQGYESTYDAAEVGSPSGLFECNPSPLLFEELWSSLDQWARTPPPRVPLCP